MYQRLAGSLGGKRRAARMTAEARSAAARKAAVARWSNPGGKKPAFTLVEAFGAIEAALRERGPAAAMAVGPLLRIKALLVEG